MSNNLTRRWFKIKTEMQSTSNLKDIINLQKYISVLFTKFYHILAHIMVIPPESSIVIRI